MQRRRDVQPRVERGWTYALLRAFTTVVSRDVCVQGVINDVAEGRAAIYVDLLGYDEVAHHSGPERADALAVLRDLDHQIGRIARSFTWAPRPYHLVVLSDHGQTQGPTFRQRNGEHAGRRRRPALRRGRVGRRRRRAGAHRVDGVVAPGPRRRGRGGGAGTAAADRARVGQPGTDLAAGSGAA